MQETTNDDTLQHLGDSPIDQVFLRLRCSREGLSSEEAASRLQIYGPNKLDDKKKELIMHMFLGFMWNPVSWATMAALVLAIALGSSYGKIPYWTLILSISNMLLWNPSISLMTELYTRKLTASFMIGLASKTKVLRDGQWIVQKVAFLVPGDIISIRHGDVIPADARILEIHCPLKVDQSAVVSESPLVMKSVHDEVLSGLKLTGGEMEALVIATGGDTFFGKAVHHMFNKTNRPDVLTAIHKFCIYLIGFAMLVDILVMILVQHRGHRNVMQHVLILLIGGVPVSLSGVFTFLMQLGYFKLFQLGAFIKRFAIIEKMAKMDSLCCDSKIGALSLKRWRLEKDMIEVFSEDLDPLQVLLLAARASSTNNNCEIDATVAGSLDDPLEARAGITEIHFSPCNLVDRRSTLTYTDSAGNWHRVSKGAPEQVARLCNCTGVLLERVNCTVAKFSEKGFLPVAVARQRVPEESVDSSGEPWQLVGILPLHDPPRYDSAETIRLALDLGVDVKMITGDQLAIAKETGRRLGIGKNVYLSASLLGQQQDVSIAGHPIEKLIEEADGFAGAVPEHKYEIVKKLQESKHIVGMTGNRVGDALALKKADIGIAAVDSTAAVRIASDIALIKPGLSVICNAIVTSRAVFQRMKNCTIHAVAINVRNLFAFVFISLIWKFDLLPWVIGLMICLNEGALLSMILLYKFFRLKPPSPRPEKWKLKEIFGLSIGFGVYLAMITVFFFWLVHETDFFPGRFGVRDISDSKAEIMSALYLQVTIAGQSLIFVTRSRSWSFIELPDVSMLIIFLLPSLFATCFASGMDEGGGVKGFGSRWCFVIWIYNIVFYLPLDIIKFCIRRYFE